MWHGLFFRYNFKKLELNATSQFKKNDFHCNVFITETIPEEDLYKVKKCGMGEKKCQTIIGLWAVGFSGYCINGPTGYRVGTSGYKQAVLEVCL